MADYAYICAQDDDALTVIDVTDRTSPAFAGSVQDSNNIDEPRGVRVVDNYAFVVSALVGGGGGGFLNSIDISNPGSPIITDTLALGFRAEDIDVAGDYAYIVGEISDILRIVDISDPTNLVLKGSITGAGSPNFLNDARRVRVSGSFAYVTVSVDDGLTVIDVSDVDNPAYEGGIYGAGAPNFLNTAHGLAISGNFAYIGATGDNSFVVINISTPSNPTYEAKYTHSTNANRLKDIKIVGNYAYCVDGNNGHMAVIDISTPSSPTYKTKVASVGLFPRNLWVVGNYAYVSGGQFVNSLNIVDITNPLSPSIVGNISGSGSPNYLQTSAGVFVVVTPTVTPVRGNVIVDQRIFQHCERMRRFRSRR